MAPDYDGLRAEAALPEYAGMDAAAKASAIRAKAVSWRVNVPVGTVEGWCRVRGLVTRLQLFLRSPPPEPPAASDPDLAAKLAAYQQAMALYVCVNEFYGMLTSPHAREFSMSDPIIAMDVEGMLEVMVLAGIFTSNHRDGLLALSLVSTTRDKHLGFIALTDQDVLAAEKTFATEEAGG